MGLARSEEELAQKARAYLKARISEAGITYGELAMRMKKHGHPDESENTIKQKLKTRSGTFGATFLLAATAALELDAIVLGDL